MMVRQKVPDLEFKWFVIGELSDLFSKNKIKINTEYQRGEVWKQQQKIELIKSIESRYSIGILVLFINGNGEYEILDGQQRLLTIKKYLEDKLDLKSTSLQKYSELPGQDKILLDAYCVYYLKLKSFDEETKEEDIVQTFLRLQEGSPLNKAEKINAHRGKFKDTFIELRKHQFFSMLGDEKRFRWRLLSAEFLFLELESDFDYKIFPDLGLDTFKEVLKKYELDISSKKITFVRGNLDMLSQSLNIMLSALQPRELISFYLLISFLRKDKADNTDLVNEFANFSEEFLKNLNGFSVYDSVAPNGMDSDIFDKYKVYKEEARQATSSESLKKRFSFLLEEFKRIQPYVQKDKKRLQDTEQKRILYFRQKGICPECKKKFKFKEGTSHHVIAHSQGGKTDDLEHAVLLHDKCHQKLEKRKGLVHEKSN